MPARKFTIELTLTLPDDAYVAEVREYVKEALGCWGGQRHPDDPFFGDVRPSIKRCTIYRKEPTA